MKVFTVKRTIVAQQEINMYLEGDLPEEWEDMSMDERHEWLDQNADSQYECGWVSNEILSVDYIEFDQELED